MLDYNVDAGRPAQNGGGGQDSRSGHVRQRSLPFSELMFNSSTKMSNVNDHDKGEMTAVTERRIELIRAEDKRYRAITFAVLKKVFEESAEEVLNVIPP
jgi:hypothetical protein